MRSFMVASFTLLRTTIKTHIYNQERPSSSLATTRFLLLKLVSNTLKFIYFVGDSKPPENQTGERIAVPCKLASKQLEKL